MRRVSVSVANAKVGYSLPVAAFAAVVAAAAAALLIRPRGGLIEPAAVDATAYFSAAQLERAEDFRDPQRLLALAGSALSGVTLARAGAAPAARAPRVACGRSGARRRPERGIALVLVLVNLPLDAVRHDRAVDVGLSTQDWGPWLGDVAKAAGIGAVFAAAGGGDRGRRCGAASAGAGGSPRPPPWWRSSAVVHLRVAARDRADLQRLRRAAGGRAALRGAGAGRARRRGRGGGLPGRREPPHDGRERLRGRARAHEARRALRQPDRGLHARRGALGRRARARRT